jgi:hypothetical protein
VHVKQIRYWTDENNAYCALIVHTSAKGRRNLVVKRFMFLTDVKTARDGRQRESRYQFCWGREYSPTI